MSEEKKSRPSFSPSRRWKIGFDVVLRTALVLAVAVMVNFLGAKCYHRFYVSQQTRVELSSRTLTVLHSLTNHIEVTLYYDTRDANNFYPDILDLLNAYRDANKNISLRTVDYTRDPTEAMKVKEKFNLPGSIASPNAPPAKDLIIFACGDRHDFVPGAAIIGTQLEQKKMDDPDFEPGEKGLQLRRKPVTFNGEVLFTSKLLALAHGQPLRAYYLKGHGESSLEDTDDGGYQKFALALAQNDILVNNLELLGGADVPTDCSLLVIAPPAKTYSLAELEKIERYLAQGGKLLALFNYTSRHQPTGLESILKNWGVNVLPDYVKDTLDSKNDQFVFVRNFNPKTFVNPLSQLALEMVLPRPIVKIEPASTTANAPQVDALVGSSEASTLAGDRTAPPRSYPLITAIEQKPVAGAVSPRGSTRIIVAGDSLFLDNQLIEAAANRDFLNYAANWLCDREQLLSGIAPRPVTQFRLTLSQSQHRQLRWLLLGALPGGVLLFGWLVWLVRRK
ncbi:MAG: hypothetical protein RL616_632 [Verrucomicrobiota bacterium]|jgi:hypothetical protein